MTAYVIINLLDKYKLDPHMTKIHILKYNTSPYLGGTSAQLLPEDKMSVYELMHGMMLPSGNDAAQALACFFGNFVLIADKTHKNQIDKIDANLYEEDYPESETNEDEE